MGQLILYTFDDDFNSFIVPTPPDLADQNICMVEGLGSDTFFFFGINSSGEAFIVTNNSDTGEIISLTLPSDVQAANICSISGITPFDGDFGIFLALDTSNDLYFWLYSSDNILVPASVPAGTPTQNICDISSTKITGEVFTNIITTQDGAVYTWFVREDQDIVTITPLEVPLNIQDLNICKVSTSSFGDNDASIFSTIDINGNLSMWVTPFDAEDLPTGNFILELPFDSDINFCQIGTSILSTGIVSVIDTNNILYNIQVIFNEDTQEYTTNLLSLPPEFVNERFCSSIVSSFIITALTTTGQVVSWFYNPGTQEITLLELPPEINNNTFCDILSTGAITCGERLSCPQDIIINSSSPAAANFTVPNVDSCYRVEATLIDGTIIEPNYLFPIGTTQVTLTTISRNCCNKCSSCCPVLNTCQFNVTIIPIDTTTTLPPSASIINLSENMESTKIYDWVNTSTSQNIRVDLE